MARARRVWGSTIALTAVLGLAASGLSGCGGGSHTDTTAFQEAVANLATSPGVRYSSNLGFANMQMRFTATGEALGKMVIPQLGSGFDMLEVDGRLFTKLPAGLVPHIPGMPDLTGRWITMSQTTGPLMRDAMTPSALAFHLSQLLATAGSKGLRVSHRSVGNVAALEASMPAGDLYVHRCSSPSGSAIPAGGREVGFKGRSAAELGLLGAVAAVGAVAPIGPDLPVAAVGPDPPVAPVRAIPAIPAVGPNRRQPAVLLVVHWPGCSLEASERHRRGGHGAGGAGT